MAKRTLFVLSLVTSVYPAKGETLGLLENDPQNTSATQVQVSVSDGITSVDAVNDTIFLSEGGGGSLTFERFGILVEQYGITDFGVSYAGPYLWETTVGVTEIPITVILDEVRFFVRNQDESP